MADDLQLASLGARRVSIDTDPDDLVLLPEARRALEQISDWLRQPPFIFREWGLSRYVDGGFRALFRGPSGTGKTMAAVSLAKFAAAELFHVDCAAAVSKYIGETEKNLKSLFAAARDSRAILLFDAADALFAQRSDARDRHDRHSNCNIAYLLRQIEPFEGLAIVTTNRPGKIDEEAVNRIDVLVDFLLPDEEARVEIWRRLLGSVRSPLVSDLDFRTLAKNYDLSGAEILRCVRMAALMAASSATHISTEHLQFAANQRLAMRDASQAV